MKLALLVILDFEIVWVSSHVANIGSILLNQKKMSKWLLRKRKNYDCEEICRFPQGLHEMRILGHQQQYRPFGQDQNHHSHSNHEQEKQKSRSEKYQFLFGNTSPSSLRFDFTPVNTSSDSDVSLLSPIIGPRVLEKPIVY